MQRSHGCLGIDESGPLAGEAGLSLLLVAPPDEDLARLMHRVAARQRGWRMQQVPPEPGWQAALDSGPVNVVLFDRSAIAPEGCFERARAMETDLDSVRALYPKLRIMVFGHNMSDAFVRRMIRLGVHGLVDAGTIARERIAEAIDEVHQGGYWVSRRALEQLVHSALDIERIIEQGFREQVAVMQEGLTRREADVLERVLQGLSTRQIAGELFLSEQGVKLHLTRLFKKFAVSNRAQLILRAFQRVCPFNNYLVEYLRQARGEKATRGRARAEAAPRPATARRATPAMPRGPA